MIELGGDIKEIIRCPFAVPVMGRGFMGSNEIDAPPLHAILVAANFTKFSSLRGSSLIPDGFVSATERFHPRPATLAIGGQQ